MRIRTHPGEVLREEFMAPLGLSANALALAPRVPVTSPSDIIVNVEKVQFYLSKARVGL